MRLSTSVLVYLADSSTSYYSKLEENGSLLQFSCDLILGSLFTVIIVIIIIIVINVIIILLLLLYSSYMHKGNVT